ncbi:Zn(2)-C6 fungal-type domain-containing protein [Mycena sanguinolenta]|uniref:Zn(2)-C6 fungal-type domain-containing protein n=1 Tax=Mycena sanguinolenta TaxID=230812 RepID=A0A8H6WUG2_9AGAR|nr:Zn(2)-C6 fungal-type domain-containing protein [Mycena sanguinolenta]
MTSRCCSWSSPPARWCSRRRQGCDEDDVHRQKVAAEAEHLHQIARAALALQPVLEKPSLVTIQTLHLLSIYTTLGSPPAAHSRSKGEDEGETSMEMTWSLITPRRI